MKKVYVICTGEQRDATLMALHQMGLLHIEHIREPEGFPLDDARGYHSDIMRAVEALRQHAPDRPAVSEEPGSGTDAEEIVRDVLETLRLRKEQAEMLEHREHEYDRLAPFGSFDPEAIRSLAAGGVHVRLYKASPREKIEVPDDAVYTVHHRDRIATCFSVISRTPPDLPCEEVRLPESSPARIQADIVALREKLAGSDRSLTRYAADLTAVLDLADYAEDKVRFLEAREGMGASSPLAYICGYCPEGEVGRFRTDAAEHGWGILIEDVQPTDRVPTNIEVPGWVKPIRVVFGFIGVVPGYDEVDISAVFLLFFSLFFAMIVGDAGYGALFLGATFLAHRRFRRAPASAFHLLYITSAATVIWGVLTGNYFGIAGMPAVFRSVRIDWLNQTENIMLVCFLLGAIHLTIAHAWNFVRRIGSLQALAQLGSICVVWTMFFLARFLVLNEEFPRFMLAVFAAGVVMLILFMTPVRRMKTEWFNHVMLPLNLVGNFVDVVSYVRLFAVGTATLAVASAFNGMAMEIGAGSRVGIALAVLIIFLGHALNIVLAAMGVLVHGIRLNTLEFAGHLGLQWTGIRFLPFVRKSGRPMFPNRSSSPEGAANGQEQREEAS